MLLRFVFALFLSVAVGNMLDERVRLVEHALASTDDMLLSATRKVNRLIDELERTADQVNLLMEDLERTTSRLHELTNNAVLLYAEDECPEGFRRAHEYEDRFLFIDGDNPGKPTPHSANEVSASIEKPCDQIISVADSGMVEVCRHTDTLKLEIDTKKLLPHTSLRACVPENWMLT